MNRRTFLAAAGSAVLLGPRAWAADLPRDVRITRVIGLELQCRRPKYIGRNSRRDDHGFHAVDRIVRVQTDAGLEGIGSITTPPDAWRDVPGKRLADFFRPDERRMVGPFERSTSALWDLAGKVLGKPVYELLGGTAGTVPVYDGSIYFVDLIPDHARDWSSELRRHLDLGTADGHTFFKVKVGRGAKWMPQQEGDARDAEVLRLIRRHLGPDAGICIDANDGYDLPRVKRLLSETADLNLAFIEEMIPVAEDRYQEYVELRAFLRDNGLKILIADGEDTRRPQEMRRWAEDKVVDIYQGDMNLYGFEDVLEQGRVAALASGSVAPHNWGSLFGYYLQLQVARAMPNFYRAEQDPMSCPALIAEGYRIREGRSSVPAVPGLGLRLDEAALPNHAKPLFEFKA